MPSYGSEQHCKVRLLAVGSSSESDSELCATVQSEIRAVGPTHAVRFCAGGYNAKSDSGPWATVQSQILRRGQQCRVRFRPCDRADSADCTGSQSHSRKCILSIVIMCPQGPGCLLFSWRLHKLFLVFVVSVIASPRWPLGRTIDRSAAQKFSMYIYTSCLLHLLHIL